MRRCAIVVLGLLVSASAAFAEPEIKPPVRDRADRVRLTGYAEESVQADKATMTFIVTTEKGELAEALAANAQVRAKAAEFLQGRGLNASAIKSTGFCSIPNKGLFGNRPASYEVENRLLVEVKGEQEMLAASELAKTKEIVYAGVKFEYTKRDELRTGLSQKACQKLAQSREAYEKAMGVKLVPVAFAEQPSAGPRNVEGPIRIGQDSISFAPASVAPPSNYKAAELPSLEGPIPNELTFGLRVTAEYNIDPAAGK